MAPTTALRAESKASSASSRSRVLERPACWKSVVLRTRRPATVSASLWMTKEFHAELSERMSSRISWRVESSLISSARSAVSSARTAAS